MPDKDFSVVFDNLYRRQEKRIAGDTIDLMEQVLANAGLDEGQWVLKDSHRIKRKGRERFHPIRTESRGGAKSVRLWCKPKGNDTCFEYSLVIPQKFDADNVLAALKRTNPITLENPESNKIFAALLNRVEDRPPSLETALRITADAMVGNPPVQPKSVDSSARTHEEDKPRFVPPKPRFVPPLPKSLHRLVTPAAANVPQIPPAASTAEISVAFDRSIPGVQWADLKINESCLLSDQEVMDSALIAMTFVMHDKYAKKAEASNSIVDNLGLVDFLKISGGIYTSKEGAMRSLMMALNKGNYIERIYYTSPSGRSSEAVKGYKITPKGEKRILLVAERCSDSVRSKMSQDWNGIKNQDSVLGSDDPTSVRNEINSDHSPSPELDSLGSAELFRLETLISDCKKAGAQIAEIDLLIANLDSELSDLNIDAEALRLAEEEKVKQIDELKAGIEKIRTKKEIVDQKIDQKKRDKEDWEKEKAPVISDKIRVENEIFELTGRRRTQ